MGLIRYTALRELEEVSPPFELTSISISASAVDDSFNASLVDLSGLLADEWVLVAGFANAANNGWFQVKQDSTSGKIVQVTAPLTHVRLPAIAGNYASTPDAVANSITGDIEIIAWIAPSDGTPYSIQTLVAKWNPTGDQRCYAFSINSDGTLNLSWSQDGTAGAVISKNSTVSAALASFTAKYLRARLDSDNGAAGNTVTFDLSDDAVTWTPLGSSIITAGTTSIHNGDVTAFLEVGTIALGTDQLFDGRVYLASVANSFGGAPLASFDPSLGDSSELTFEAATGESWTIHQSGSAVAQLQGRSLVTEAAGPAVTITGYKRGLNQSYDLEFYSDRNDRSVSVKRSVKEPLGNAAPEVLLFRRRTFIDVTVIGPLGEGIPEEQMLQWAEFFASVEGGEAFVLDRYGTADIPGKLLSVMLESESYSESRIGATRRYMLSFQARIL